MVPAIRLLPIFLMLAAALVPVPARAGADMDKIIARMLVGKGGASVVIKLNTKSRTLEVRTLGFDGSVIRKDAVRLDSSGKPMAWQVFDGNHRLRYRGLLTFDSKGRTREALIYNQAGKMVRTLAPVQ